MIPKKTTTFAALAKANNGLISAKPAEAPPNGEPHHVKTKGWRVLRGSGGGYLDRPLSLRQCRLHARHGAGHKSALVSESDMVGSLVESTQVCHRLHSLGTANFPGTAPLQRGLFVLPAPHDHGCS